LRPVLLLCEETKSTGVFNRLISEAQQPQADVFWSTRVAVLEAGRLVQAGTIDELHARPATPFVEALLADRL
jgi:ABC-type proline/glycine betaine transport system ATPase subunit